MTDCDTAEGDSETDPGMEGPPYELEPLRKGPPQLGSARGAEAAPRARRLDASS